ncbi:GDSL-type esterase/lipase family protein [Chitinophaga niabensis]|uniref:Lysophospholipase L1 n=1 Tax=Chitinophaga niabensis TaxID=536979 RepID=A0A1N6H5V8_9BACT|nr:GDSL-type esterase/lipase family protein [Chitinophaga niabensis]SIO15180.1 Lysophospholipase L1 [Chitinophaga niabensis]
MKRAFLIVGLCFICFSAFCQDTIKVACIGASITYGARIKDPEHFSFPGQLQTLLGAAYKVSNFGVSGTTLLRNGNAPYHKTGAYQQALASKPDIVIIDLGGNDSKLVNRSRYAEFVSDYDTLIKSFSSHPRIILLLPVVSFVTDTTGIWDPVIVRDIIPMIRQVGLNSGKEVVDMHSLLKDKPQLMPDKIHPEEEGSGIMAKRLYEQIKSL